MSVREHRDAQGAVRELLESLVRGVDNTEVQG